MKDWIIFILIYLEKSWKTNTGKSALLQKVLYISLMNLKDINYS